MAKRGWKSKLTRVVMVDWRQRGLLLEAVAGLIAARVLLAARPFRAVAKRMGSFVPVTDPRTREQHAPGEPAPAAIAGEISWAVTRAAAHVPFKAVCLPQAMVAQAMLKRRGIASVVHFGTRRTDEKPIDAHAWVEAAGVEVTGYPMPENMTPIGAFV